MRYVIVTSRCPVSHDRSGGRETLRRNVGGVVTALHQAMKANGGVWICWGDGNADMNYPVEDYEGYTVARIFLNRNEKHGFYDEYSNGTLWPLFHYFRERVRYVEDSFETYSAVNRKFAEAVAKYMDNDSVIWVHDYQLSLVPEFVRKLGIGNFIIFTWHIPWVSSEFFNILPQAKEIVDSITQADMITFHTELYRKNFRESCERLSQPDFNVDDRTSAYSLGIDSDYYSRVDEPVNPLENLQKNGKVIFSIDRLDYTKGLINRVLSVERVLKKYPDTRGRFHYVMMVTPSRTSVSEYIKMKRDLETEIGRINGSHGDIKWQPIIYMYSKISDRVLLSYYRYADIALITPVMDGLNLVSKEFVAASRQGILILSEFAGAAFNLPQALIVNPNDISAMADTIYTAMNMDKGEIARRLEAMKTSVTRRNLKWWIDAIEKRAKTLMANRKVFNAPGQ
ncbi:MAG: trehalose-6-phosphate synthase [Thermoplasmataceae archaeon]|jgi:trehalose 6-phosphate synthase